MYSKVFSCFITAASKLYSDVLIHPLQRKFIVIQFKVSLQNHICLSRGYCVSSSYEVNKRYDEMYEKQLNEYLKDPNYAEIYEKYKAEIEHFRIISYKIPESLKAYDWVQMLQMNSRYQRRAYLEHLWKKERKEENALKKKELKKVKMAEANKDLEETYKMGQNTLFHRIRAKTIMNFYNSRLINAMLYSSPIVFDLAYDDYMTVNEISLCAKQLLLAFSENRSHNDPCNLYFCNANRNSLLMQKLHRTIPPLYDEDFPLNITSKSYLEIFDKSKLVYLTPHCHKSMTHFDHDAVYIIGAMVDKVNKEPLSLQKARKEGLKMVKFPLSEKVDWGTGSSKTLPLNQVLSILLDLRTTDNWEVAMRHIPRRKLKVVREQQNLTKIKKRAQLINTLMNRT